MDETRAYIFREVLEKYNIMKGYYIDTKWINFAYINAPVQIKKYFNEVLKQMINEDFFECKEGHGDTWFLTQKGEDAIFAYIEERNKREKMKNENMYNTKIEVNPVISPVFNQTNTNSIEQTLDLNIKLILKEQLGETVYKSLEEIIKSSMLPQEKKNNLISILGKLGVGVTSELLATLICKLPWV